MPPAMISCTSPYSPSSSRAARASQTAARVGMPVCSWSRSGLAQVVDVDAVAAGQHLVDEGARVLTLGRQQAAVAGGGRAARLPGAAGQGHLGVVRQGAVTHAGDHYRDVQLDRFLGVAGAEDG